MFRPPAARPVHVQQSVPPAEANISVSFAQHAGRPASKKQLANAPASRPLGAALRQAESADPRAQPLRQLGHWKFHVAQPLIPEEANVCAEIEIDFMMPSCKAQDVLRYDALETAYHGKCNIPQQRYLCIQAKIVSP